MHRLLVSGSREYHKEFVLCMAIIRKAIKHPDIVVVHGDCPKGADRMAKDFCKRWGIPQDPFPANWDLYGKPAGHIRNKEMVDTNPDFAFFFLEGKSSGTLNCLDHAIKKGIPYRVYGEARS